MTGGRRIRTDLALETTERFAQENTEIRGVEIQEDYDEEKDIRTTVVKIVTENGAKSMGRPQGTYITIEAPDLSNADEDYHREISQEISRHLRELINLEKEKSILGCGSWKCGDHSRCTGTACDRESSYDAASYQGVWTSRDRAGKNALRQRDRAGCYGTDRDGDGGDRAGCCFRDKTGCGGCNRCTCGTECAEAESDNPDHRYGNPSGIRRGKPQERAYGRKSSGKSDRDRCADSCGCGDDRA